MGSMTVPTRTDFDIAFERTLSFEGGFSDHKDDKGGLTRYGISQRAYPREDIQSLTIERAKELYRRDYWSKLRLDGVPYPLNVLVFDFAVNSGVARAAKTLQRVLGVSQDGAVGAKTLAAAAELAQSPERLRTACIDYIRGRYEFIGGLMIRSTTYHEVFGRGWLARLSDNSSWLDKQMPVVLR